MNPYTNENPLTVETPVHRVFGAKENSEYIDRKGAYIIPLKDDKVGVIETAKGFFLIGGGMDYGESEEHCIIRECIEETGYQVEIKQRICSAETYCEHLTVGFFHPIQVYYSGILLEKIREPSEVDHAFRWISIESVPSRRFLEMQSWAIMQVWERSMQSEKRSQNNTAPVRRRKLVGK